MPTEAIHIRRATLQDWPWARALYSACFGRYARWWTRPIQERQFKRDLLSAGFVAELQGRPVGFGAMSPFAQDPGLQTYALRFRDLHREGRYIGENAEWWRYAPESWELSALAVEPESRRQGVGRALAGARLEFARQQQARAVFVRCVHGSGSLELYEDLGFTPLLELQSPRLHQSLLMLPLGPKADDLPTRALQGFANKWRLSFYERPLATLASAATIALTFGLVVLAAVFWWWLKSMMG